MPGTYSKGKFDIAGFAVGIVSEKILNKKIKNDLIQQFHQMFAFNGYSLVDTFSKK